MIFVLFSVHQNFSDCKVCNVAHTEPAPMCIAPPDVVLGKDRAFQTKINYWSGALVSALKLRLSYSALGLGSAFESACKSFV